MDRGLLKLTGILIVGALAPVLDTTIVNVGVDALGRGLHAPVSTVQWAITGYLLALGMAVPVTGWLADRYGAKRIWLAALVLFLAGSVLSGAAWNVGALIGFRVLQGAGAGLMLPILQTLLVQASGGRDLGKLMATVSMPALVGPILGPVLGGLIIGNLSWRWMFYVNVPVCLAALLLAGRYLPTTSGRGGRRLDLVGLALLSPGVAAVIYGLSRLAGAGATGRLAAHGVWLPPAAGVLLLAVALVVRGAGLSAANLAVMAAAYQGLSRDQVPHASSATRVLQQIGGAFGTAVLAVILARQAAGHPLAVAFGDTFWWSLAFTALAAVPALFLVGTRRPAAAPAPVS